MRNTKKAIDEFMGQKSFAVVGVSRNKDKFGTAIYREMKNKGLTVYAVNPQMDMVEGDRCYAGLGAIPTKPDAVVAVIPSQATIAIIDDMAKLGIKQLWLQQGAESREAEEKATALGMNVVSGECMFMFLPPVESLHKFHRTILRIFGKLPK
jgi:predicted CoA-binding protein